MPSLTPCLSCKKIGEWGRPRCPTCHKAKVREVEADAGRRAVKRARYGYDHQATRARYAPLVATGSVECPRCKQAIRATQSWDLDHLPNGTYWPSHSDCNRAKLNEDMLKRSGQITPAPAIDTPWPPLTIKGVHSE